MQRSGLAATLAVAALGLAIGAALWTTGPAASEETWAPAFLLGYAVAWVCYVAAGVLVSRSRGLPRWVAVLVVVFAIGMRLIALERTPLLSTDSYRYLWDGRVANAGINPFVYPPDARELRGLRDENWRQISFKQVPTIYPPAAQLAFRSLTLVRPSDIEAFRWTFALFDMGTVLVLVALLLRTNRPPERVIWYAWCPLAIAEVTAGSHVDAVALFLLLLALLLVSYHRAASEVGSGVALAGAVMTKGLAILALPFLVRRGGWRLTLAFAVTCAAFVAPYLSAGARLFGGLRAYLTTWKANASIFLLLDGALIRITEDHYRITRSVTSALILLSVTALAWKLKPGLRQLLRTVFLSFAAMLALGAPTLPWYALWVVPALCWWTVPGLALFILTVSAQYYARWLYPGDRATHYLLLWAGYLPVYALLIGQCVWWAVRQRRSAPLTAIPSQGANALDDPGAGPMA